jgi:hypothetical protein
MPRIPPYDDMTAGLSDRYYATWDTMGFYSSQFRSDYCIVFTKQVVVWHQTDVAGVGALLANCFTLLHLCLAYISTLKMGATCFSETSVYFHGVIFLII